jgi:hypothetical protein
LPAHEGRRKLPALIPEEGPDERQGGDTLIGIDFFVFPVGELWSGGFEFDSLAFHEEDCVRLHRFVEKAQGVLPVFVSGNADGFVRDG